MSTALVKNYIVGGELSTNYIYRKKGIRIPLHKIMLFKNQEVMKYGIIENRFVIE